MSAGDGSGEPRAPVVVHLDDDVLGSAALRARSIVEAAGAYRAVLAAPVPVEIAADLLKALPAGDEGDVVALVLRAALGGVPYETLGASARVMRSRDELAAASAIDIALCRRLFEELWLGERYEMVRGEPRAWSDGPGHVAALGAPLAWKRAKAGPPSAPLFAVSHRPRAESMWQVLRFGLGGVFDVVVCGDGLEGQAPSYDALVAEAHRRHAERAGTAAPRAPATRAARA